MNESEINARFERIEKRLDKIEHMPTSNEKKKAGITYKGLVGGINFLMNNNFFNEPHAVNEIVDELKKEGYHYPSASIDKILRDFVQKKKILTRINDDGKWKYVLRK